MCKKRILDKTVWFNPNLIQQNAVIYVNQLELIYIVLSSGHSYMLKLVFPICGSFTSTARFLFGASGIRYKMIHVRLPMITGDKVLL